MLLQCKSQRQDRQRLCISRCSPQGTLCCNDTVFVWNMYWLWKQISLQDNKDYLSVYLRYDQECLLLAGCRKYQVEDKSSPRLTVEPRPSSLPRPSLDKDFNSIHSILLLFKSYLWYNLKNQSGQPTGFQCAASGNHQWSGLLRNREQTANGYLLM